MKQVKLADYARNILNGANEEAVALLLNEKIKFLQIAEIIEEMNEFKYEYYDEIHLE